METIKRKYAVANERCRNKKSIPNVNTAHWRQTFYAVKVDVLRALVHHAAVSVPHDVIAVSWYAPPTADLQNRAKFLVRTPFSKEKFIRPCRGTVTLIYLRHAK